jgi:hypothetical protein
MNVSNCSLNGEKYVSELSKIVEHYKCQVNLHRPNYPGSDNVISDLEDRRHLHKYPPGMRVFLLAGNRRDIRIQPAKA